MYYGEKLNSITHLVGAILALIGFGALLTIAFQEYHWRIIVGFIVFGITLITLYTMSTLYHSFHPPKLIDVVVVKRIEWLQIVIYLAMGWICVFKYSALQLAIPGPGIGWLTIGGIAYTVGIIFYVLDDLTKMKHAHGIWHLFVLMGSISHFISIAFYVR